MDNSNQDILAIFSEAVAQQSAVERTRFLDAACAGNPIARQRLDTLLRAHFEAGNFLSGSLADPTPQHDQTIVEEPGSLIDSYRICELLAEGGMGVVYMAEQTEPVRRRVALKVVKPGMDTKQVIARFEAERQALAVLDHPYIAKVLDAGSTDSGRPYFVMDLVQGVPITEFCDQHRFTTRQRLEVFAQVCDGVRHAHDRGIIHRDIKPSNVMVMLRDGGAVPKVIDFGIAKAIDRRLTDEPATTVQGQLIGTPQYMSPEQADFTVSDVDARSDVYSLGVLLYELLVGMPPFGHAELSNVGYNRMCQIIRETQPPRPSKKFNSLGAATTVVTTCRQTRSAELSRQLRGDLDVIVMKALEKDRQDRYSSVAALAEDVHRYLRNEPILANPPTLATRLSKWVQRHRTLVGAAALVLLLAVLALSTSTVMIVDALGQTQSALARTEVERNKAQAAQREAQQQRDKAVENLYVAQMRMAEKDWNDGQVRRLRGTLLSHLPAPGQTDLRGWEWYYHLARINDDLFTFNDHPGGSVYVSWSPDGTHLASRTYQTLKVWNPHNGDVVATVDGGKGWGGLAWCPDGDRIALTSKHDNDVNQVKIWDLEQRQVQLSIEVDRHLVSLAWSPDGKQIVVPGPAKTVVIWDAETGAQVHELTGHDAAVVDVAWSPNGQWVAASSFRTGTITIWELGSGEPVKVVESGRVVVELAWSPDSSRLAAGTESGEVGVWTVATGEKVLTFTESGAVTALAWNPTGSQIACGGGNVVSLRDAESGEPVRKLRGHTGVVTSLSWSPDGNQLASGSGDGVVKVWDVFNSRVTRRVASDADARSKAVFSPDDRRLAYLADGQVVKVIDVESGTEVRRLAAFDPSVNAPMWNADGSYLAFGNRDGSIVVFDVQQGELATHLQHTSVPLNIREVDPYSSVAVSWHPDGEQLASASEADPFIRIWDVVSGVELEAIDTGVPHDDATVFHQAVAWSPDGERLAVSAAWRNRIEIWDRALRRQLHVMKGYSQTLVWSRDGRYLASAGNYHWPVATVWDTFTGRPFRRFQAHTGWIDIAGWSDANRRIATAGGDGVRIWDPRTGQELFSLPDAKTVSWSHDRRRIATVSNGDVVIHDASTGYQVAGDPNYGRRRAIAMIKRAFALARAAEHQASRRELEAALRLAPDETEVQWRAAWLLTMLPTARLEDPKQALELATMAAETRPESPATWQVMGWAHYRMGQWQQSVNALQKSIQLQGDGGDPFQWLFLAMAHWKLGQEKEASQWFERSAEWIDQRQQSDGEIKRFRDEAAELLGRAGS